MADGNYKAFIVEGEAREPLIIDNISKVFFAHSNFKIIVLPAEQNIYMLWKKLKEDDFDTDIIVEAIDVFAMRLSCLMNQANTVTYDQYREIINPHEILKLEEQEIQKNRVFILSAFPEFLLDYFGVKLWRRCVKHTMNQLEKQACNDNHFALNQK